MLTYEAEYDNRALVPEHPRIIEGWMRDAEAYRAQARTELGLAYGPGERERLDLFGPEVSGEGPVGLFIHGGYWKAFDRSAFSHMARGLNAHGLAVAVPSYDLCPHVPLATIVEQIRQACQFLWARLHRPLLVFGHSAGGHLTAAMLATRFEGETPRDLVRAGLAVSGVFDLLPLLQTSHNEALGLDEAEGRRLSTLHWAPRAGTALDVAVGGAESAEFRRQSRTMADVWSAAGARADYLELPGENHFTAIASLAEPDGVLVSRLLALARTSAGNL